MSKIIRVAWRQERKVSHDYNSTTVGIEVESVMEDGDNLEAELEALKVYARGQVDYEAKKAKKALMAPNKS